MAKAERVLFFLLVLLLPTQLGRHFWPDWTQVLGLRIDYLAPTIYLTDLLIFSLLVFSLPSFFHILKTAFEKKRLHFLAGVFLLATFLLGIVHSKVPLAGLNQLVKWGEFIFFAFYLSRKVGANQQIKTTVLTLAAGVVFEALLSFGQFWQQGSLGGPLWFLGERTFTGQTPGIAQASLNGELFLRAYGTFSHPNVLAGYLVVSLILILGIKQIYRWEKVIVWWAIVLGILALFSTFSRSAWTIGFLAIFYWLIIQRRWLVAIFLLCTLVLSYGFVQARFQALFTTDQESWQRRQELNLAALEMFKSSPVLGVGLGNFLVELPRFHQEKQAVRFFQPAHNFYLMVASETGIFGLGVFLAFLFLTYKRLFTRLKKQSFYQTLAIALSVVLALSFFDHYFYTLQQGQLILSFILGLSWSTIKN